MRTSTNNVRLNTPKIFSTKNDRAKVKLNPGILLFCVIVVLNYFIQTYGSSLRSTLISVILGLTVGFFISLFENHSLQFRPIRRRCSFYNYILIRTVNLSIALAILLSIPIIFLASLTQLFDVAIFPFNLKQFYQSQFWEILLLSVGMSFFINSFLEINRKLGPGVFLKLISGKYYNPQSEERIFLFIDLNNSTYMAEHLGDLKFSQLLQDFFYDISEPVRKFQGEIYQYVGDEVVISWSLKKGIKNNNSVNCYMEIKNTINGLKDYYIKNYGLVPNFKAGMHCGQVVLAEVGKIKTEIAYHGDVLNSTSRITDLCKSLKTDFLISESIVELLNPDKLYAIKSMGSFYLKGKTTPINLYCYKKAGEEGTESQKKEVEFEEKPVLL